MDNQSFWTYNTMNYVFITKRVLESIHQHYFLIYFLLSFTSTLISLASPQTTMISFKVEGYKSFHLHCLTVIWPIRLLNCSIPWHFNIPFLTNYCWHTPSASHCNGNIVFFFSTISPTNTPNRILIQPTNDMDHSFTRISCKTNHNANNIIKHCQFCS